MYSSKDCGGSEFGDLNQDMNLEQVSCLKADQGKTIYHGYFDWCQWC